MTSIFGALYFGRAAAVAVTALGGVAFVVIGWATVSGHITPVMSFADTRYLVNWARVGGVYAILTTLIISAILFVIGRVEAHAGDLRVAYERLGQLHQRVEDAKEEERRFLAHELHDDLGQSLTALKLQLQAGARAGHQPDPLATIDHLIGRVRQISGGLRPPLLDEVGLVPAVRAFLDAQSALTDIRMTVEANELATMGPRLAPALEITCFRIVQEATTNAVKHAGARDLRVRLDRTTEGISLRIDDDGRGFHVGARLEVAAADGHLGMVGMRERVRTHGGAFRVRSGPGAGTTIEVELPV
jgi:two-component system sensor histidine kinase UhpB